MNGVKSLTHVTTCMVRSLWLIFLTGLPGIIPSIAHADGPPNLVWIMADDLGYAELGCYGQKEIQTPYLDQMAREGMRFTQFYAGATVCAPSRSVLMTGQHHGRTRVRGNSQGRAQALRDGDITLPATLKSAGYRTFLVGKWGLGDIGEAETGLPRRHGFDQFFGYLNQQHAHNHFPDYLWLNEEKVTLRNEVVPVTNHGGYATKAVEYADDLFTQKALETIEQEDNRPFFLYWSMVTPHANNERKRTLGNGAEVPDLGIYKDKDWPEADKAHAAMVSRMDADVGAFLQRLKDLGLDKNTLVIFTSDNGPHNESGHDLSRFQPAGKFSGIKRSLKDGGIRVPMIAWWPGTISPGSVSHLPAYFGDYFATACELAGVDLPEGRDSISFVPTLRGEAGKQKQHEFLYWEFHERGFQQAALYQGRWKGIRSGGPTNPIQLFDQLNDPSEQTDVAAEHPEIVSRIDSYLQSARTDSEDWIPKWTTTPNRNSSRNRSGKE